MNQLPTKIFAHRGASIYAPENTMAAFKLAYQLGAEGIETDVHLTKDSIPVLIHDASLSRTTNGTGYVHEYTFDELKQLDAGSWFSTKFTGVTIVSLEELLKWIQTKPLTLNIELKNNKIEYKHLESIVYEMVRHYKLLDRTILSTFNIESLKKMQPFRNSIELAYITSKKRKNLVTYAKDLGVHALHIKYPLLKRKLMKDAQQENITIRVYTVNKPSHMNYCFKRACDAIFTDIPDEAIRYRSLIT